MSRRERGSHWVVAIAAALISATGGIVAAVILILPNSEYHPPPCVLPSGSQPKACIDTPQVGDTVEPEFTVTGKLDNIPPGSHVWIATKLGNLVWPKQPEVKSNPVFNVEVIEGGNPPGGTFSIVVLLVNSQAEGRIKAWLNNAENGLPGLSPDQFGKSMEELDTVPNLHL